MAYFGIMLSSSQKISITFLKSIKVQQALKANISFSVPNYTTSRRIKKKLPKELPPEVINKRHAGIGSFESVYNKGFSIPQKAYNPPNNVEQTILNICQNISNLQTEDLKELSFKDPLLKYKVLTKCIKEFEHEIPNCILHTINNGEDLLQFFSTPVAGLVSYDQMVRDQEKLPKNLQLIANPVRFDPDTDTFFGGVTAFPNSQTVVASLRHKIKYKSHQKEFKWPDV